MPLALTLLIAFATTGIPATAPPAPTGPVVDFVHVHFGSFSWYIFNIADAAIVVGVAGLLYESFRPGGGKPAAE